MSEPHICSFGGSSSVRTVCPSVRFDPLGMREKNTCFFSCACVNYRSATFCATLCRILHRKREGMERQRESERLRARARRAHEETEQRACRLERNRQRERTRRLQQGAQETESTRLARSARRAREGREQRACRLDRDRAHSSASDLQQAGTSQRTKGPAHLSTQSVTASLS